MLRNGGRQVIFILFFFPLKNTALAYTFYIFFFIIHCHRELLYTPGGIGIAYVPTAEMAGTFYSWSPIPKLGWTFFDERLAYIIVILVVEHFSVLYFFFFQRNKTNEKNREKAAGNDVIPRKNVIVRHRSLNHLQHNRYTGIIKI